MDPSDKLSRNEMDVVTETAYSDSRELAAFAGEYFQTLAIKRAGLSVLASFRNATPFALIEQNEAWQRYNEARTVAVAEALATGGEDARERTEISAHIHVAMLHKMTGDDVRYFGELQSAAEDAYQANAIDDAVDETIHAVLEDFLNEKGIRIDAVIPVLLRGTETDEQQRLARGEPSLWDEGDPLESMSDTIAALQLSLEEALHNGADIQDLLGDFYRETVRRGDDPVERFKELGF